MACACSSRRHNLFANQVEFTMLNAALTFAGVTNETQTSNAARIQHGHKPASARPTVKFDVCGFRLDTWAAPLP